jgi:hypothetical protein
VLIIHVHMTGRLLIFIHFSLWSILVVPLSAQYVSIFDTSVYEHDRSFAHNVNFPLTDEIGTLDPLIVELGLSTDDGSRIIFDNPSPNTPNDSFSNFLLRWADSQNFQNPSADEFQSDHESEQWSISSVVNNDERTYERLGEENLVPQISAFLEDFIKIRGSSFSYFTLPAERFHYDTADLISLSHDYRYALTDQLLSHADSFFYHGPVVSVSNKTKEFSEVDSSVFSFRPESLHTHYPNFSFIRYSPSKFTFNAFLEDPFVPIPLETQFVKKEVKTEGTAKYIKSNRQRRNSWVFDYYKWEINDFDPTNKNSNLLGAIGLLEGNLTNFDNGMPNPDANETIYLEIIANDGIDSLDVLAYGMTGGNALNDYTGNNGFHFMTATGWGNSETDVTSYFNLITTPDSGSGDTGIDAWLNGFDGYNQPTDLWGVYRDGDKFYLTYEFSNLNFSPVPEPSTYFMTGALFCLIGLNRTSRNSIKKLLYLLLVKFSRNYNAREVKKNVS